MVDDLRRSASDDLDEVFDEGNSKSKKSRKSGGLLGMSAFERMILSILLFMLVAVMGVLLLVVSGRILL
jgi:hypothetical protein